MAYGSTSRKKTRPPSPTQALRWPSIATHAAGPRTPDIAPELVGRQGWFLMA